MKGERNKRGVFRQNSTALRETPVQLSHCTDRKISESHSVVSDSLQPHGLYSPWNSPGQNTGVGNHSLLQRIFPTQGVNPGLPPCSRFFTVWATREATHIKYLIYVRHRSSHLWDWKHRVESNKWFGGFTTFLDLCILSSSKICLIKMLYISTDYHLISGISNLIF